MKQSFSRGIELIEVAIGASIILIGVLALISTYNTYVSFSVANSKNIQAALLVNEGFEAVKFIRDSGWNSKIASLSLNTAYYLNWNGTTWTLTTTPQPFIDTIFWRTLTFSSVNRDANNDIASSGGTLDSNTKKVTVSVAFRTSSGTTTKTASTYITNLLGN